MEDMQNTITKEEMLHRLFDEYGRNEMVLHNDDPKKIVSYRQKIVKAQLEAFGVNVESFEIA